MKRTTKKEEEKQSQKKILLPNPKSITQIKVKKKDIQTTIDIRMIIVPNKIKKNTLLETPKRLQTIL